MSGKFITFEGIEGCGKTTQIKLLNDFLQSHGHKTVLTREPGGTPVGDKIRSILLDPANKGMCPLTELLLYAAGRAQHVEQVIKPAIANGIIVLSDRYADATEAYQGAARKLSPELLKKVHILATGGLKPDITILLDVPAASGLLRAKERSVLDRFEQEDISFHERVREGYLKIARAEPKRVIVVDGMQGVEEIHKKIIKICRSSVISPN